MRTLVTSTAAALTLVAALVAPVAGQAAPARSPSPAFASLSGMAVPIAQLGDERAKGVTIGSSTPTATMSDVSVGPHSWTGSINDNSSVANNTGITTVFQNTGNNSLIQNSTAIYITVH